MSTATTTTNHDDDQLPVKQRAIRVKRRPLRCRFGFHQWHLAARWGIEGERDVEQYRCHACNQLGHRRVAVGMGYYG